jgi:hypothetical protein
VDDFTRHAQAVKASVWGYPETSTDYRDFYDSKFTGEAIHHPRTDESAGWTEYPVCEGWSSADYLAKRWAGCQKTSSRNAHTALRK